MPEAARKRKKPGKARLPLQSRAMLDYHTIQTPESSMARLYRTGQTAFSTWPNSSSTGVARPKISTETRRRLFS